MGKALAFAQNAIDVVNRSRPPEVDYAVSPVKLPQGGWIGISTPTEDVRDCLRYPNSPYCGGSGLSVVPVGYEVDVKNYGQQTCVRITPSFVFITGAPLFVCAHNPFIPPPKPPKTTVDPLKPVPSGQKKRLSPLGSGCTALVLAAAYTVVENFYDYYSEIVGDVFYSHTTTESGLYNGFVGDPLVVSGFEFVDSKTIPTGNSGSLLNIQTYYSTSKIMGKNGLTNMPTKILELGFFGFPQNSDYDGFDLQMELVYASVQIPWEVVGVKPFCPIPRPSFTLTPAPQSKPPAYNPESPTEEKPMACCEETNDLLRLLLRKTIGDKIPNFISTDVNGKRRTITSLAEMVEYYGESQVKTSGASEYPVTVPETLIGQGGETTIIKNTPEFLVWIVKQLDGLIGEFPLKIRIKDTDPLKAGDQPQDIEIPNIAEGLAEMYGLSVRSTINSELLLNFLTRLTTEVVATKNMAVTTQDYTKATASWLGYRGEPVKRKIHSAFDLTGSPDDIANILRESDVEVSGWKDTDKENLIAYLQKLLFAAGIIKGAFFRGKKQRLIFENEIGESIESGSTKDSDATWNRYTDLINNPESIFNKDQIADPKIEDVNLPPNYQGKTII
jgi:hypothetical protein